MKPNFVTRSFLIVSAAILFHLCAPSTSLAWGDDGHRIIGRIAAEFLTVDACNKLKQRKLLRGSFSCDATAREELGEKLAAIATWADGVRYEDSEFPETYNWHFVDISLKDEDYDHDRDCDALDPQGDCGLPALKLLSQILRGQSNDRISDRYALRFIVHIVGDLHQPLHTVKEKTGGNFYYIVPWTYTTDCLSGNEKKPPNLHSVWDSAFINRMLDDNSQTEAELARSLATEIKNGGSAKEYAKGTAESWLLATHKIARENAYGTLPPRIGQCSYRKLTKPYYENNRSMVELQLKRAGVRLASTLNWIFTG